MRSAKSELPWKTCSSSIINMPRLCLHVPFASSSGGWAGPPVKMEDGSDPQPWHCLPFVEGSTYGLELVYPYENECHVVNDDGAIRFDWDYASEPGGGVTGGEFVLFSPVRASKYYLFNTRLDIQTPPGYALRTEPHPRFFTDDTGTVPCSLIGHLQNEWYPRLTFVVFRAPMPGKRHIFRKGEPFVQLLFVPTRAPATTSTQMTSEEAEQRRELEQAIQRNRFEVAENRWRIPTASRSTIITSSWRVPSRGRGWRASKKWLRTRASGMIWPFPRMKTWASPSSEAQQLLDQQKFEQAQEIFLHILSQHPDNAEALTNSGICFACMGNMIAGYNMMARAVALQPKVVRFHTNLAELLRRMGRFAEAEASIRSALGLNPNDPNLLASLGLIFVQQGRAAEGYPLYQRASALGCSMPATHLKMGLVLAQNGHFDLAQFLL